MMLDETRSFSTLSGLTGGAVYKQDGKYFNIKKMLVENFAPDGTPAPAVAPAVDAAADAAPVEVVAPVAAEDLDALHWKVLKQRVEAAGGEWIDKAAAIAFLSK